MKKMGGRGQKSWDAPKPEELTRRSVEGGNPPGVGQGPVSRARDAGGDHARCEWLMVS